MWKMGMIIKHLKIVGDKGESEALTLFDSGASDSVIRKDVAQKVATIIRLRAPVTFVLRDDITTTEAEYGALIDFVLKDSLFPAQRVFVVEKLEEDLILGADAFQRWKLKLDFEHEDVIFDKSALKLRLA